MGAPTYRQSQYRDSQDFAYYQMIRELLKLESGLTEWEIGFLDNVKKLSHTSQKQRYVIEKIYQKRMPDNVTGD